MKDKLAELKQTPMGPILIMEGGEAGISAAALALLHKEYGNVIIMTPQEAIDKGLDKGPVVSPVVRDPFAPEPFMLHAPYIHDFYTPPSTGSDRRKAKRAQKKK